MTVCRDFEEISIVPLILNRLHGTLTLEVDYRKLKTAFIRVQCAIWLFVDLIPGSLVAKAQKTCWGRGGGGGCW